MHSQMSDERAHWEDELRSAYLYSTLAEAERAASTRALFRQLAHEAQSQSVVWATSAAAHGKPVPATYTPDLRARVVANLARRLGARAVKPMLAAMKVRGLSALGHVDTGHALPSTVADVGRRHRGGASVANLRAAIFGANDGLVSNASLVLGVAGASSDGKAVLLSGVAGLLAGAFSMAAGEYLSVRSQREMLEHQLAAERAELAEYPEAEAAELALIYEARGLPREDAQRLAKTLVADPVRALDVLAREELGVDPHELASPWGAALFSFFSFAVGAVLPLVPLLLMPPQSAVIGSAAVAGVGLFGIGAAISLFTGRGALHGGLRMLIIGSLAGAATFGIGKLLGVAVQ